MYSDEWWCISVKGLRKDLTVYASVWCIRCLVYMLVSSPASQTPLGRLKERTDKQSPIAIGVGVFFHYLQAR